MFVLSGKNPLKKPIAISSSRATINNLGFINYIRVLYNWGTNVISPPSFYYTVDFFYIDA